MLEETDRYGDRYRDFATAVVVIGGGLIPMVKEINEKFKVAFWKFSGGRRDGKETPEECAARELFEEIGLRVDPWSLIPLRTENRGNHDFYLFGIRLSNLPKLKAEGDEEEEVGIFSLEGLKLRRDIFPKHWRMPEVHTFIYGEPVHT